MNAVNVLEKKDTVYLAGMTGVSMKKGRLDRAEQSIFWTSITTNITRTRPCAGPTRRKCTT